MQDLIDDIYEAAVVPHLWLSVLERMSTIAGGAGASFVTGGPGPMRWVATPAMEAVIQDHVSDDRPNPRIVEALSRRYPGWLADHLILSPEVIDDHPFYRDFMRPRGYGWCIGTVIFPPSAEPLVFSVERRHEDGPADASLLQAFDSLRPHLARSATLSAQLALERAQATTDALGRIGLPAAVLGHEGRLRSANTVFESLVPRVFRDQRTRLSLSDGPADALFASALARILAGAAVGVCSLPIRTHDEHPPVVVHLLPVRRTAHDIFARSSVIVIVTPVVPGATPSAGLLEGLFDLTPAEARIAKAIGEGGTMEQIARDYAISAHTVRTQLKAVFTKTGTSRQSELARLLSGLLPVS